MFQYQIVGIVLISAIILVVMIFIVLEMHSKRIANIVIDSANLADSNMIVTHNTGDSNVSEQSEEVPDMSGNCNSMSHDDGEMINAIIKVSYEPKTNHIMVDSSVMVRFMICMFLMKLQQSDKGGMFKALALWAMTKFALAPKNKV